MINPLNTLLRTPVDDGSHYRWGYVTSTSPTLQVVLDTETDPIQKPSTLVPLDVGDRVFVLMESLRATVLGKVPGPPAPDPVEPDSSDLPSALGYPTWSLDGAKRVVADTADYLTFPSAVKMDSGRIVVTWGNQDTHVLADFGQAMYSDNNGSTWSTPVIISDHATYVRSPIAVTAHDTRLALMMLHNDPPGRRGWLHVTTDPTSWGTPTMIDFGQGVGEWIFPCALAWIDDGTTDGLLLAVAYGSEGVIVTASDDVGATWTRRATPGGVFADGWSEATITHLGGNNLLMMLRNDTAETFSRLRSSDMGFTWTAPETVLTVVSGLPLPTLMPNGLLVMPARDMVDDDDDESWSLAESRDGGETWTLRHMYVGWMMYGQVVPLTTDKAVVIGGEQDRSSSTNSDIFAQDIVWLRPEVSDTVWINLTPATGYTATGAVQVRRVGSRVELRGRVTRTAGGISTAANETCCTVPSGFAPTATLRFPAGMYATSTQYAMPGITVNTDGTVQVSRIGGPSGAATHPDFHLAHSWFVG